MFGNFATDATDAFSNIFCCPAEKLLELEEHDEEPTEETHFLDDISDVAKRTYRYGDGKSAHTLQQTPSLFHIFLLLESVVCQFLLQFFGCLYSLAHVVKSYGAFCSGAVRRGPGARVQGGANCEASRREHRRLLREVRQRIP